MNDQPNNDWRDEPLTDKEMAIVDKTYEEELAKDIAKAKAAKRIKIEDLPWPEGCQWFKIVTDSPIGRFLFYDYGVPEWYFVEDRGMDKGLRRDCANAAVAWWFERAQKYSALPMDDLDEIKNARLWLRWRDQEASDD